MVKVTDKDYYLDGYLREFLDKCYIREEKNHDNLTIIDGYEGFGKTTLGIAMCYYYAYTYKKAFSCKNIFFDLDSMLKFAATTERQVILWDEAALGGMAMQWQNKTQQKLVQILMVARKKRHFWIFIIPKVFKLNEYIAVDRAIALINVYSSDQITRGKFAYFSKEQKTLLFDYYRRKHLRAYRNYKSFVGKFTNTDNLVDMQEYDQMKDNAIEHAFAESSIGLRDSEKQLIKLKYKVSAIFDFKAQDIANEMGVGLQTIYDWRKLSLKHDFLYENPRETPLFTDDKARTCKSGLTNRSILPQIGQK